MRPTADRYFLDLARLVATRSTCLRRSVGCVLVSARRHVLATGYNGVAAGLPHCDDPLTIHHVNGPDTVEYPNACRGARAPSGSELDACEAIHAEQNALLQCRDAFEIDACYATVSPCLTCVKFLLNTSCRRVVFAELYAAHHDQARELWERSGRTWEHQP